MGRKSKQPGGHHPLTYHERTKKFASSEYGTVSKRLAGHSQYQIGDCALTVTELNEDTCLCSPSGYLYQESAILEYLLTKTQELKQQRIEYEQQQQKKATAAQQARDNQQKRKVEDFQATQQTIASAAKKSKVDQDGDGDTSAKGAAVQDLKRVSYWLADAQPKAVDASSSEEPPPERPGSPVTGEPLRRKDLWSVQLDRLDGGDAGKLVCAVSHKTLASGSQCLAYWTDKKLPGRIVLQSVYKDLIEQQNKRCPLTDAKIKYTRTLQQSGSSFAASGQNVAVQKYRPTIT